VSDDEQHAESLADESIQAAIRLALIPGIGPAARRSLLERFETSEAILAAAPSQLRTVPGIGPKLTRAIVSAGDTVDVGAVLRVCAQHRISIVTDTDPTYPRLLREIHDPPALLFVHGRICPEDAMSIAIVGTRHATAYGKMQAERLAAGLARAGLTVVSGLARGIDAAAHRGALQAGGRTLAVLASGVLNVYPPEHRDLAFDVRRSGALISENPPHNEPVSGGFPQRNRLITGMSLGVVVVEAAERSGALISAQHAMEQGREVFAVPGRVDNRVSRGCHRLIREGAKLVECVDDVLEELGPLVEATPVADGRVIHHPAELQLNDQERQVLEAIETEPTSLDAVVASSGLPVHRVLATVSVLEMRHLVRRVSGNYILRL
jgi:DNA processing protein